MKAGSKSKTGGEIRLNIVLPKRSLSAKLARPVQSGP